MIDFDLNSESEVDSSPELLVIPDEDATALAENAPSENTSVPAGDADATFSFDPTFNFGAVFDVGATLDSDTGAFVGAVTQSSSDDADIFQAGDVAPDVDGLAHVTGFDHGQDIIDFSGLGAIADSDFTSSTADDFAAALAAANAIMAGTGENVVAVQVGADVIVFADTGDADQAGSAILLVGRTLADVGASDFG